MKLRTYLPTIFFLLTIAASINAQTEKPIAPPRKSVPVNSPADKKPIVAPPFNLTSLDGKNFDLAALRGKVVVLNLWFTGCPPCLAEIPKLNELVEKFKKDDVVFIAPTLDKANILSGFLKQYPFKYHIVANAGDLIIDTYGDGTGNIALPTHFVIDKEGNIDTRIEGPLVKEDGGMKNLIEVANAITRLSKRASSNTPAKTAASL